ncbi:hypothetical protein [Arcanobacterium hippocoleae]|uniref:hypothetical protein n=1 Tax=Arcanobacterium hippocoleae TaxID=149017 RepID=UPI003341883B
MLRTHLALMLVTAICVTLGLFTMHKIGFAVISANIFIAMLTIICASIIITALYFAFGKLFRISQIDQMLDFLRKTLRKFTSRSTH